LVSVRILAAVIAAVGVLGSTITIGSGVRAFLGIVSPPLPDDVLGVAVNRGLAWGFMVGTPIAGFVFGFVLIKSVA
jgi:hypothetical protein